MSLPQLEMERALDERLAAAVAPPGYLLRTYRPGDGPAWCRLVNDNLGGKWTEARFQEEMARAYDFQAEDLLFAEDDRQLVGTTWALSRESPSHSVGEVHLVAVAPDHRGKGLGRVLVSCALRRLQEKGHARVRLLTDDVRLPAIKVYLGVGFRPRLTHASHFERWRKIYDELGLDPEEVQP